MTVTLEQYEQAEGEIAERETGIGLKLHALITLLVWAVLIPVNILAALDFSWSIFVVVGMGIGLFFHWVGYRHADEEMNKRQHKIDERSATFH